MRTTMTTTLAPVEFAPLVTPTDIPVVETERDRFDANRQRVTAALRANADRQITGSLTDGSGGVCFVGCAAEVIE